MTDLWGLFATFNLLYLKKDRWQIFMRNLCSNKKRKILNNNQMPFLLFERDFFELSLIRNASISCGCIVRRWFALKIYITFIVDDVYWANRANRFLSIQNFDFWNFNSAKEKFFSSSTIVATLLSTTEKECCKFLLTLLVKHHI